MNINQKIFNFLRRLEKYTKTDMIYLTKGGFWLVSGQVISSFAVFLSLIAFANLLPPVVYGNYKYLLSIFGLLSIFSLTGMGKALAQAVARGYEGSIFDAFWLKLKWSLGGSLVVFVLAGYYWLHDNNNLPIPLLLAGIFLPLMQASNLYSDYLGGRKDFKSLTKFNVLNNILGSLFLIAVLFFSQNLFIIIAAYLLIYTFLNAFFFTKIIARFRPNLETDEKTLSYGKHLSLMDVLNVIAEYFDRLLIFQLLGATELAIYSLAIAPVEKIKGYLKNIQTLALPKFSLRSGQEIKSTIYKKMSLLALFILIIVIFYIIFIPFAFRLFFPQYLSSIGYSQIFALSLVASAAMLAYSALLAQMARKELYRVNIIMPIIQIILLFICISFWGLWGAIWARVIIRFLFSFFFSWSVKKFEPSPQPQNYHNQNF